MILQELLRNIVTYKEVIKPYIDIWKEAIELRYGFFNTHISTTNSRNEVVKASVLEAISVSKITGTRTIQTLESLSQEHYLGKQTKEKINSATVGNNIVTMLMGDSVCDDVVMTSRTISFTTEICLGEARKKDVTRGGVTTGFIFEKHKITHEERELLGGFSLSHERHSLLYISERR